MSSTDPIPQIERLARLADGTLLDEQLAARVAESPQLTAALAEQRSAIALISAAEQDAPAALHARVAALGRRRQQGARLRLVTASLASLLVVLLVALTLGSGGTAPSALGASRFALLAAVSSPPAATAGRISVAGSPIAFPDYSTRGWPAVGVRHDTIGGHRVTTVLYAAPGGGRAGYAIVSGTALRIGGRATIVVQGGVRYSLLRAAGSTVLTWVERGHTCVLASRSSGAATLLALAGWGGSASA